MKSSRRDKIKGAFKEAKGKVKEETGKAIRNPDLRDRGNSARSFAQIGRKKRPTAQRTRWQKLRSVGALAAA